MTRTLTTRPNLDHFRGQAKTLIAELRGGDAAAARAFIEHIPKARGLSAAQARSEGFRLADAQSVVARRNGFASWPALVRHVEQLRTLEGEWSFESLQVDGADVAPALIARSKLLLDGDRFRMDSPEATYDGRFGIDTSTTPMRIDMEFIEGPEAGNWSYGIFEHHDDRLMICLGLVGAPRPTTFATRAGSGHALERLRRTSASRPAGVTGGVPVARAVVDESSQPAAEPGDFATSMSPMLRRLEGTWAPVRLVTNGDEMSADWLQYGSRTGSGNEAKVGFGGQVMLHVKMRIDESVQPIAVDYLHLHGRHKGKVSHGILEWLGEEVQFLIATAGKPRPASFAAPGKGQTLSRWRRPGADLNPMTKQS